MTSLRASPAIVRAWEEDPRPDATAGGQGVPSGPFRQDVRQVPARCRQFMGYLASWAGLWAWP